MTLILWLQHLGYLLLNLSLLAVLKLRFPDSFVGKTISVIA